MAAIDRSPLESLLGRIGRLWTGAATGCAGSWFQAVHRLPDEHFAAAMGDQAGEELGVRVGAYRADRSVE